MAADLTNDDKAAGAGLLRDVIAADRFPHAPRIKKLRAILAKLEPPPTAEPLPAPKPPGEPSWAARKRRR